MMPIELLPRPVTCCAVFAAMLTACSSSRLRAQESKVSDVTIEQIIETWNSKQDRIKSARFEFSDVTVIMKGTKWGRHNRSKDDEGNPFPKEDLTLHRQRKVVIDGLRFRHDRRGEAWVARAEDVIHVNFVELLDGKRRLSFHGRDMQTDWVHPVGYVYSRKAIFPGWNHAVWPIAHTFRARHPGFVKLRPFDASAWRLTGRTGTINGRRCLIVEEIASAEQGQFHRLWVDPQRDFCVLRKELGTGNLVMAQLDIEYKRDASGMWVPTRWTDHQYAGEPPGPPTLLKSATYAVTDYGLNVPIDEETFQFEFPPGTEVINLSSGETKSHLVRESGVRPITEEERWRGARYSDFLKSDSGEARLPPQVRLWHWWPLAAVLVLAALGWFLMRHR